MTDRPNPARARAEAIFTKVIQTTPESRASAVDEYKAQQASRLERMAAQKAARLARAAGKTER